MKKVILSIAVALLFVLHACGPTQTKVKEEASSEPEAVESSKSVVFENPLDGATVSTTFKVAMGVEGMTVEPAGEVKEGFGHHHILINQPGWPEGEIIPPSDTTIHYGKGQIETELTLEPGDYTISLQFADGVHRSYGESMATSIKVTVQ